MRRFAVLLAILTMLTGCAGHVSRRVYSPRISRRSEKGRGKAFDLRWTAGGALYICRAVRESFAGKEIDSLAFSKNAPQELTEPYAGRVFVSIYGRRARFFKAAGQGDSAAAAALQAIKTLAGKVQVKKPAQTRRWAIKVDFTREIMPPEARMAACDAFIPGVDGLWLLPESHGEYRLPAEIMSFSPATSADLQLFFTALPESGPVRRFRTRAFLQPRDGAPIIELTYSLPPGPEVTAELLKRRIAGACEYLVRNQHADGSYKYLYRAISDRFSRKASDSMVRHAAAPAAMIVVGEALGRKDFVDSVAMCLDYLQTRLKREDGKAYFLKKVKGSFGRPKDRGTLGGSGVLAWTVSHYRRVSGNTRYDWMAREAVDFILSLQKPDGSFYNYYDPETKKPVEKLSRYYQGEACLGLYWYYKVYGGQKYLDAALRGVDALAKRCDKLLQEGSLYIDAWLMQAARFLYPLASEQQKEQMLGTVKTMAELVVKEQRTKRTAGYRDIFGSFRSATHRLPSGPGTAALCEGLAGAYHLLKSLGQPADEIKATLIRAAEFQLMHQYWGENTYFLPNPARAKGGIKGTLTDNRVRIDHVQHTAASLLEVLKILESEPSPQRRGADAEGRREE